MLVARGRWALPDSTTISRMGGAYGDALRGRDGEPRAWVRRLLELVDHRHREVGVGDERAGRRVVAHPVAAGALTGTDHRSRGEVGPVHGHVGRPQPGQCV